MCVKANKHPLGQHASVVAVMWGWGHVGSLGVNHSGPVRETWQNKWWNTATAHRLRKVVAPNNMTFLETTPVCPASGCLSDHVTVASSRLSVLSLSLPPSLSSAVYSSSVLERGGMRRDAITKLHKKISQVYPMCSRGIAVRTRPGTKI